MCMINEDADHDLRVVAAIRGAVVRFDGTTVLHGVDLELYAGEVHALVGQNGAGKSTLVKALTGVNPLAEGQVEVDGKVALISGPQDARRLGLEIVYQDQPLAAHLTVAENIFLGREPLRHGVLNNRWMIRVAQQVLERVGARCSPNDLIGDLTPTQRVQVSIAAALAAEPKVLILDEPTAALGSTEAGPVFEVIRTATRGGVAVLYISHRLGEITALADRVTVLRDGRRISVSPARTMSTEDMVTAMVGRDLDSLFPTVARSQGATLLKVSGLQSGELVQGLDLSVGAGEIVGLAGLVGSGASEALLALFGDRTASGRVTIGTTQGIPANPRAAIRRGFALVPEERRTEALFPGLSLQANLTAASLRSHSSRWILSHQRERDTACSLIKRLGIVTRSADQDISTLSGGNQQKAMVGRWLARGGQIYLVDEPTAGVDVAAKAEIYRHLGELASGGAGVLVVSSDFEELIGLCDRVLIVRDGVITDEFPRGEIDEGSLTSHAATAQGTDVIAQDRSVAKIVGRRTWIRQVIVALAMLTAIAALAVGSPGFLLPSGFWDVLRQAGTPALLAAALAVALGAGAFDLSVGAIALLAATVSALLAAHGVPTVAVLAIGVLLGAAAGAINGMVTVALRVPSFVATLGMLFLLVGVTLGVNGGLTIGVPAGSSFLLLAQGFIGSVPAVAVTVAVVIGASTYLWRQTRIGLRLRAAGDDVVTARLRGVRTGRGTISALIISGALSGLAGVLLASYGSGATARDASLDLLVSALAAAFLGSALTRTFLFDPGTAAIGSLFITAIGAGLISNGLSDQWLGGVQGVVLLLAVLVAVARRRILGQVAIF